MGLGEKIVSLLRPDSTLVASLLVGRLNSILIAHLIYGVQSLVERISALVECSIIGLHILDRHDCSLAIDLGHESLVEVDLLERPCRLLLHQVHVVVHLGVWHFLRPHHCSLPWVYQLPLG